ncbi:MAG TPA: tetratricopeptide repeat protein [Candidatus Thalassarchaeaceae archaeon]|nr:tetratricopeptide repeat protein [Candidatus Thalassarchaeaceae archaeon]HIH82960.1 tetratricopeptide repeat protein [Candidatus Thalassarchaeaceae archaeon]
MAITKPGVQERILLHLRDYGDYSDKVEVPFALSQMGIANAVAIARSNVPRAIAGLKDQGLLIERQTHVTGVTRKRKAYFLTDSGMIVSDETWERLSSHPVRLIGQEGTTVHTTLSKAIETTPFTIRAVDIIRYMDDNGLVDLRSLNPELIERDLSKHVEKQLVLSLGDLPRLRSFYGRDNELKMMVDLLNARSTTILVPGIAGIGKTALAGKLIETYTHQRNLLYHRVQDWEGSRAFLEACGEWLTSIGDDALSTYLTVTPVPVAQVAVDLIVDALAEVPALIVIDDLHKVADDVLYAVIRGLNNRIDDMDETGLILFSRSFKEVVPLRDAEGKIRTLVVPLDGLDREACRHLLPSLEPVDEVTYHHIYGLSRGHPLVLNLIDRGSIGTTFYETLEMYVDKEIFSKLSGAEKRLLGALAVFREPMPLEALSGHDLETDLLDDLVEKGLARQADSEMYDVHDLIREFLTRALDEGTNNELHAKAVDWYRTRRSRPEEQIEFLFHLSHSGDTEELGEELSVAGAELVQAGHMELFPILDSVEKESVGNKAWPVVLELKSNILSMQGRWKEAEEHYNEAIEMLGSTKKEELMRARIKSSLADISVTVGHADEALTLHKEALESFIKLNDPRGAARTYNNMGYIYRRQRDDKRALEVYANVEELLDSEKDPELVESRIKLASAFLEMSELDRAKEHAFKAHDDTTGGEDAVLHARARAVLGRYYSKTGDPELALHHYTEALDGLSEQSDSHAEVEITLLLGEVLVDSGRRDEAMECYRQALALAESNDYRMLIGELLARLGEAAPDKSRRMEYLQRSLTVFRELGANDRMRDIQTKVHRALMG